MSADYTLYKRINIKKLQKVKTIKILDDEDNPHDAEHKVITDGTFYVHIYMNKRGTIHSCSRFGGNNEDAIFEKIQEQIPEWHPLYIG